jgi:ribose transport system ATP-binding protein
MTQSEIGPKSDVDSGSTNSPLLVIDSVSKRFGTVRALSNVSLDCEAGEIHGVLGENGSGKSTLFGIASGVITSDTGRVAIAGEDLRVGHPSAALERGLAMAYQTYSLVPELSIAHNLLLSVPPSLRPKRFAETLDWAAEELNRLDVDLDPRSRVGDLRLAERQFLEVVKALVARPRVLLLDEPTTALGIEEVGRVHALVSAAVRGGAGVMYVSHRLPEIMAIADRITILRDGERIGTFAADAVTEDEIVALMIGRPVELAFPERSEALTAVQPRLVLDGLGGERFGPVDMEVRPGEILGLAGAEGNGQEQIIRALAGVEAASSGAIRIDGVEVRPKSPVEALTRGLMLLSGERVRESLFPVLGVRVNVTVGVLKRFSRLGFVNRRDETHAAANVVRQLNVRTPSIEQPVRFLSGGNQQKVVLARPILGAVDVLLAEEPTQGVDIKSRFEIYEVLRSRSREGMSVLVRSADAIELAGICDRVVIVSRGQVVREVSGADLTEDRIVEAIIRTQSVTPRRPAPVATTPAPSNTPPEHVDAGASVATPIQRRANPPAAPAVDRPWVPVAALAVLSVVVATYTWQRSDAFLTAFNMKSLLLLTVPLAFASMGQLQAMLLGAFDVSIGALMGLTVVCASFLVTDPSWTWNLLGITGLFAIACSVGLVNVVLIRGLSIPSIIATIATLSVLQGITLMLRPTPDGLISTSFVDGMTASWGFVPYSFLGVVALAIAFDVWLFRTRDGLTTRAVGLDDTSARRVGVSANIRFLRAFLLSSLFLAALVGIGDPRLGTSFTLPTLAAAVLGGAALGGGRGSFIGAVNGALFLTLIINVLPFLGWPASWGDIARGGVTLAALAFFKAPQLWQTVRRARHRLVAGRPGQATV